MGGLSGFSVRREDLARLRRPWTWSRTALRRGFHALVALSVLPLAPMTWAWLTSAGHRVTATPGTPWIAEVPAMPAALVLGAGVHGGKPTPMLAARLDIAAELYHAGKVRALLLSGDNSRKDYDEPTVMRDYLIAKGVPAGKIVLDYAGFDTWDSCVRAKEISARPVSSSSPRCSTFPGPSRCAVRPGWTPSASATTPAATGRWRRWPTPSGSFPPRPRGWPTASCTPRPGSSAAARPRSIAPSPVDTRPRI